MSTKEKLLEAARARFARGDGKGPFLDLGIQTSEVIADAHVGKESFYQHFGRGGRRRARRNLADELIGELEAEQLRLRREALSIYGDRAELIAEGAGRKLIEKALVAELHLYGGVPDEDELTRARERLYYLAVALCDAMTTETGTAMSDADSLVPDRRFLRHLLTLHQRQQEELHSVYGEFLVAANRKPIQGVAHLERVISAFIEGALLQDRIAKGHGSRFQGSADAGVKALSLSDEEVTDAVLRIFIALSHPADGPAVDPDSVLFNRQSPKTRPSPSEVVVHSDRANLYETVTSAVQEMSVEETLSHCALHASGSRPRLTTQGSAFHTAVMQFTERGGTLLNLEKIDSLGDLEKTVEWLRDQISAGRHINFRALVMDAPPALSPLLIGERMAFLGRENDGVIVDGVKFVDEVGRRWCKDHFEVLWSDSRSYLLASPNGLQDRGIENARLQLHALERHHAATDKSAFESDGR